MRVGIVGLGAAGSRIAVAVAADPGDELVGAVDVDPEARRWFEERFGRPAFSSIEALADHVDVDVVWVATPTPRREVDTVSAAQRGIHVVVDKPIAADIATAERMIAACERADVMLVCGGSRSSSECVRTMRSIIASGRVGEIRAITAIAATDWMLRPRRSDELDASAGGGVVMRQAPHLVDTCRLLGGGVVERVRAVTGQWMEGRGTAPGYFSAILEMANGVTATCTCNGHGYFMVDELVRSTEPSTTGGQRSARTDTDLSHEAQRKHERLIKLRESLGDTTPHSEPFHPDLGLLIVHCDRGDLRTGDGAVVVYDDNGIEELPLPATPGSPPEIAELRHALAGESGVLHSGPWGLATLEVCLGIAVSARDHRDVAMSRQVVVPS